MIVNGGLVMNWWARAGWVRSWVSDVEVGVEVSERGDSRCWCCGWEGGREGDRVGVPVPVVVGGSIGGVDVDGPADDGSEVSVALILRSGVAAMSPGATVPVSVIYTV